MTLLIPEEEILARHGDEKGFLYWYGILTNLGPLCPKKQALILHSIGNGCLRASAYKFRNLPG